MRGQRLPIDPAPTLSPSAAHNRAWLDHEGSTALLHPEAEGWDWIGMNLFDGSALTAFHLRRADGSAVWAGGSFRRSQERHASTFSPEAVHFTALAWWTSAATGTRYPIRWRIDTPHGRYVVRAVVAAQELDSRATTGAIYWEGLCDLLLLADPADVMNEQLPIVGRGYLEMTGYASRLKI